jgi:hypothetical protein
MTEVSVPFDFSRRRQSKPKPEEPRSYPARVARQLALAHELQRRLERGEFADHADLARELGFTRARISQLMNLLLLAPDIQEEILFLETPPGTAGPTEHSLRHVVPALDWDEQRQRWRAASSRAS